MFTKIISLKIIFSFLLFVSWSVQAAPEIQHWKTSKGIEVYFVHAPELLMIDIELVFDAGSSRDGKKPGLATFTSGLLAQGANGKDADAISYGFESLGANFGSSAGFDFASVSLRSLTDEVLLNKALENMKMVISKPDFPKDARERRRARILVGLKAKQQSPGALAKDAFMSAVYAKHPYAKPNDGTEESIKAITGKDITKFFKEYIFILAVC